MPPPPPGDIQSREELIGFIFELLDHNDAVEWPYESVYTYLQTVVAWINDVARDDQELSWRFIADALYSGATYDQPPADQPPA